MTSGGVEALGFGNFCFCFFGFALALEGLGLGAEEAGGFGAGPGLVLADLAGKCFLGLTRPLQIR
jgi:hypothetical protein